jgi:hypothetical protein
MGGPLRPEVLIAREDDRAQAALPLAAEGVERYVWQSRFGPMLIEVKEGRAFVNGLAGEPADPEVPAGRR